MSSAVPPLDQVATYQLSIKAVFERLSQNEKLYAHRLSQAAWHGSRIIMRQTSPEGTGIFDFILELHKACDGQWNQFVRDFGVSIEELEPFLEFAGMFLARLNNFCPTCYPGDIEIATDEIAAVARAMEKHGLEPENIRV
ncbi:Dipeptidyl-peptidase 3 [Penicillium occitanis (nom. inval.)]|nr:Dipeptidyl-peptidase 3 [Penicillium occitanis (nom. inval.)]